MPRTGSQRSGPSAASSGVLALVATSVVWGTTGTAQALAGASADPPVVGAARLVFGAGLLIAVCVILRGTGGLRAAFDRDRWRWTVAAGLATAVYQVAFFAAVA